MLKASPIHLHGFTTPQKKKKINQHRLVPLSLEGTKEFTMTATSCVSVALSAVAGLLASKRTQRHN